jgi:ketosteroid isomerase-like protein
LPADTLAGYLEDLTMLRFVLLTGCVGLMVMASGCSNTSSADLQAVKDKEVAWNKDGAAKDLAKFSAYYADDATLLMSNAPAIHGLSDIKSALQGVMQDPHFALSFQGDKAEVSGSLAYTQGHYTMSMSDQKGNAVEDKGKYLTVWKKQADGSWKAIEDMINSDMPPAGN